MTGEALGFIDSKLQALNVNYEFMEYTQHPVVYPYFVGEYNEVESQTEEGLQESTFILTGFTRGKWLDLEQAKEIIRNAVGEWDSAILTSGNALVITYSDSVPLRTGEEELKKIQINLKIKEWKVD